MQLKRKTKIKRNSGAAMLIAVVFFLIISLVIVAGLVSPTVRAFQDSSVNIKSKASYYLAESGSEDAYYRLVNNKTIGDTETITLNANSVTTTITAVGSQKQVVSQGNVSNFQRKISLLLSPGEGVTFKYGTQAGAGGAVFYKRAGVLGSLYSNGDITGTNNSGNDASYITGDAFAANSSVTDPEQFNGETGNPASGITFGDADDTEDFAQSFQVDDAGKIGDVQLYIKKTGKPSNATLRLTTDNGGKPNGSSIITGSLNSNLVTTSYNWIDVGFFKTSLLFTNTTYWIVVDAHSDPHNYYTIAANNTFSGGMGKVGKYDDHHNSNWNNTNPTGLDGYFKIFFQGLASQITKMKIGTGNTGDAYANTVTNSNIAGNAYCQTGNGNNKTCDTSRDDPTPADFPISDANIDQWKADALVGGVINGNYTVNGNHVDSIGPKKINGDLTIEGTLEIANTIWVTGNLHIKNRVRLSTTFGATSGIIVVDGYIITDNNVIFEDSGTSGSYIMLVTTSICDTALTNNPCGSHDAVDINHRSAISIINAQKGAVDFNNNSKVKEVVGYRLRMKEGSYIEYGSGVMNPYFTSGPSGSWAVDAWKETQ